MITRICLLVALMLCLPRLAPAADTQPQGAAAVAVPTGLQSDVVFTDYSPFADVAELTRRFTTPLSLLRATQALLPGQVLRGQVIDLAHERFALYVPDHQPPEGYSLLVFVSALPQADVPLRWISVLDRHGTIFVSAANSGNDADVHERREPLALLAAANIKQRYAIDPQRVYIGGLSGGSRVALRIALAYPDVFDGALLDAGSDPIGDSEIPLPATDLLQRFQESTRVVYLTGEHDELHLQQDARSYKSLQDWCVLDLVTIYMPWLGHELAAPSAFDSALTALQERKPRASNKLDTCRARIERELNTQLGEVETLVAAGKSAAARAQLLKIDARYGGLAAPRSSELAKKTGLE